MKLMGFLGRFLLFFLGCTILLAIIWERFVLGSVYYCSDTVMPEYLTLPPVGNWSHGATQGDWINPNWSDSQISALWYAMVTGSMLASAGLALATDRR